MDITTFIQENQVERRQTKALKWDALDERFQDGSLLPLWVADMEFSTPKTVTEALEKRIAHGVFGYSINHPDYFHSFAAWQEKRHQIQLRPDWLRFSTGVVQSLYHLLHCFTEAGDGVLIQPPVYYPFFNAVRDTKRKLVLSPLKKEGERYTIDLADFEAKLIAERPKLFILCSPHNPVGRIWSEEELAAVLELCRSYDVLVISDEIHQDFEIGENKFVSALNVADGAYQDRLIICNAPSKTFNLASLLHSHIIIPNAAVRAQFDATIGAYQQTENNLLGQLAAKTAYETGEEWFEGLLAVIRANYQTVVSRLQEFPGLTVAPLEGTYLAWIDLRQVVPLAEIKTCVQEKGQLAVDYGEWFADEYKGFIRLNLATTPAIISQALDQLLAAVAEYQ